MYGLYKNGELICERVNVANSVTIKYNKLYYIMNVMRIFN